MAEINITPFTDVILVLLIIFMIATPLIAQNHIKIKLPEASSKESADNDNLAYVTITAEGVVYLNNEVTNSKELKQKMNALIEKDRNLKVSVAADKDCRFQDVVRVIDIVKETGAKSLNISTKSSRE